MIFENILISNSLLQVGCRQERRLLLKSGICQTFENSTTLTFFPWILGSNTILAD